MVSLEGNEAKVMEWVDGHFIHIKVISNPSRTSFLSQEVFDNFCKYPFPITGNLLINTVI